MILVDTSVVIDFVRGKEPKLAALLMAHPVAVCGVTRTEFLCGARDPAHRHKLIAILAAFQFVPFPDALWDDVGDTVAALRSRGITVPLPDAIIATLAIKNDIEVWTRDPHFFAIRAALPALKLFEEPP